MCGVAGILTRKALGADELTATVSSMSDAIAHRGPDSSGTWVDREAGVALGHRRLAIVDLSPFGNQPMLSHCGRYVLSFNGEIYNHLSLRASLRSEPAWRGHSDTESILACFTEFGVQESIPMLVGMFAIAVWDRESRVLTLARDRMGEKPLYYGWIDQRTFVFGSELKALRRHPDWSGNVDRRSLSLYMRFAVVPAPYCIFQSIFKLLPGAIAEIRSDGTVRHTRYWSAIETAQSFRHNRRVRSDTEALAEFDRLFAESVGGQLMSDVPLGAFLSGGVDSSAVVAMMCRQSASRVRTFTIGFAEQGFDEAVHARAVAAHLGTEHEEAYVTATDALHTVPLLPTIYDEPFADSSQIPTFLISQMARRHVTVCLSGDGGDELFAGYNRYLLTDRLWRALSLAPLAIRRKLSAALVSVPPVRYDSVGAALPILRRYSAIGDKAHKFAQQVLPVGSVKAMYGNLVSAWERGANVVNHGDLSRDPIEESPLWARGWEPLEVMGLLDQTSYLPDDILVKVDRAAMAVSLETRVPLLDHRMVEFAWSLPASQKIRRGETKWLLRRWLYQQVPKSLVDRPKQGFGVPIANWLRGPLREWAMEMLDPTALRRDGLLNEEIITQRWGEHLSGSRNWQGPLWCVLMYQAWRRASSG